MGKRRVGLWWCGVIGALLGSGCPGDDSGMAEGGGGESGGSSPSTPAARVSEEEAVGVCETANGKLDRGQQCTFEAVLRSDTEAACEQLRDDCIANTGTSDEECAPEQTLEDLHSCASDVTVADIEDCFDELATLAKSRTCADAGSEVALPACIEDLQGACPGLFQDEPSDAMGEAGSDAMGTGGSDAPDPESACDDLPLDKQVADFTEAEAEANCLCAAERMPDIDWLELQCTGRGVFTSASAAECEAVIDDCLAEGVACNGAEELSYISTCTGTLPELEDCFLETIQWQRGLSCADVGGVDPCTMPDYPQCLIELCGACSEGL